MCMLRLQDERVAIVIDQVVRNEIVLEPGGCGRKSYAIVAVWFRCVAATAFAGNGKTAISLGRTMGRTYFWSRFEAERLGDFH